MYLLPESQCLFYQRLVLSTTTHTVRMWTPEAEEALRYCFESTECSVLQYSENVGDHFNSDSQPLHGGVPSSLVKLLAYWYSNQHVHVKWANILSTRFNVSNRVRQRGILSPYLMLISITCLGNKQVVGL